LADYLKIPDIARRLDVSEPTARRMVKGGKLPSVFIGGAYRVNEEDLKTYIENARVQPRPKAQAPPELEASEAERREPEVHTSGAEFKGEGTLDVGQDLVLIGEKRRKSIEEQVLRKAFERTERGEISAGEAMDEVLEKARPA
jgi:excisionase family DNA binding protein